MNHAPLSNGKLSVPD